MRVSSRQCDLPSDESRIKTLPTLVTGDMRHETFDRPWCRLAQWAHTHSGCCYVATATVGRYRRTIDKSLDRRSHIG